MTILIHHGSNGSYKSSRIVEKYLIPALKDGRTVVTNLEGCTHDKCVEVLGSDMSPLARVITVDGDSLDGQKQLLTWWHWVPIGALCIFDEAGKIFPSDLTKVDIRKLSYKTVDEAQQDGRPHTWIQAWHEHRKFNWDIILSAPDISTIRGDIRKTTEGAYRHENLTKFGLGFLTKGRFSEGYHNARASGARSTISTETTQKISDLRSFRLYKSTKTGIHKDSIANSNVFKSPKVIALLSLVVVAFGITAYSFTRSPITQGYTDQEQISPQENNDFPVSQNSRTSGSVSSNALPSQNIDYQHPLNDYYGVIVGSSNIGGIKRFHSVWQREGYERVTITSEELKMYGYTMEYVDQCHYVLYFFTSSINLRCGFLPEVIADDSKPTLARF